jgi:transcriptional regulator with XRE-family HTH domain
MATTNALAKVIRQQRSRLGYSSAFRFYKQCGGKDKLGISFNHYWMIETGRRRPSLVLIEKLSDALDFDDNRQLHDAYLVSAVDYERYEASPRTPREKAASLGKIYKPKAFAIKQLEVLAMNREINRIYNLLLFNREPITTKTICDKIGLDNELTEIYLKKLATADLIEYREDGSFWTVHKAYRYPDAAAAKPLIKKIRQFDKEDRPEEKIHERLIIKRTNRKTVEKFLAQVKELEREYFENCHDPDPKNNHEFFDLSISISVRDDMRVDKFEGEGSENQ